MTTETTEEGKPVDEKLNPNRVEAEAGASGERSGLSNPSEVESDVQTIDYTTPRPGWLCFHCGERFTTVGSAQDHFGGDVGGLAGCQIKVGEERGLLMELRKAQAEAKEWMDRALLDEGEIEALEGLVYSLTDGIKGYRPFRECRSINDVFFLFDSMEGRALAAEELIAKSTSAGLALHHAEWRATPLHIPNDSGGAYKTELVIYRSPERTEKINWWHEPDPRNAPHNHPWPFTSTIISGGLTMTVYREDGTSEVRTYREGNGYLMPANEFHTVDTVEKGTVTHMVCGALANGGEWGHLTDNGYMKAVGDPSFIEKLRALNPHLRPAQVTGTASGLSKPDRVESSLQPLPTAADSHLSLIKQMREALQEWKRLDSLVGLDPALRKTMKRHARDITRVAITAADEVLKPKGEGE